MNDKNKVVQFIRQDETDTVYISYELIGGSYYVDLKKMDEDAAREVLNKAVYNLEVDSREKIKELEKRGKDND